MPSKSKPASNDRLSQPSTLTASVLASLSFSAGPQRCTPATSSSSFSSLSVMGASADLENTGVEVFSSKATTNPATAARFSVPPRYPFSWLPPRIRGFGFKADRTNRAPAPLGPWNLCEQQVTKSAPKSETVCTGSFPNHCEASVWNTIPFSRTCCPMTDTGCKVPISLFAAMTETKIVSSRRAASTASGCIFPKGSGLTFDNSNPSYLAKYSNGRSTDGCSMAEVTKCRPRPFKARAVPNTARLLASVPPAVKMISDGRQTQSLATRSRNSSSEARAWRPTAWVLEGLPKISPWKGSMAARTAGSKGVVAL